jgi:hypothetical protein
MNRKAASLPIAATIATVVVAVLAAGCGGGSPGAASGTSSTATGPNGALAFARCMRSHGVPGWPDFTISGVFDKAKIVALGVSQARLTSVSHTCNRLVPNAGQPQGQTITLADQAYYLRAAECMRSHGFPEFPDPTFQDGRVTANVPASVDQETPKFKRAAATCTSLIPAGLPYSGAGAP